MLWYDINKRPPIAFENGSWDGLRSSKILVCTWGKKYHVAYMYETTMDGSISRCFYDLNTDFEIVNVKWWAEIDEA